LSLENDQFRLLRETKSWNFQIGWPGGHAGKKEKINGGKKAGNQLFFSWFIVAA
jgi:hypothetical protein